MSTRGAIAFGTLKEWQGVYNHFDSYPEGLGKEVWAALAQGFLTREYLDSHPGGFSVFPETCYCHDEYFSERDGSAAKDSRFYREDAPDGRITNKTADPLFIEWVYVVDLEANLLHVLENQGVEMDTLPVDLLMRIGANKVNDEREPFFEQVELNGDTVSVSSYCAYKHAHLFSFDLEGAEPDWDHLLVSEEEKET